MLFYNFSFLGSTLRGSNSISFTVKVLGLPNLQIFLGDCDEEPRLRTTISGNHRSSLFVSAERLLSGLQQETKRGRKRVRRLIIFWIVILLGEKPMGLCFSNNDPDFTELLDTKKKKKKK